jgi:hypothetical protein
LLGQQGTEQLRQQLVSLESAQQQISRWATLLSILRLLGMHRSILTKGLITPKTSGFQRM